jgi:hypothetical protein
MGVRIVHYGVDDCHRVPVLTFAGYSIADCRSIVQLRAALQSTEEAGAVVMTEIEDLAPHRAVWIARWASAAPLVLFPSRTSRIFEPEFDLVVPALTPPEQWLSEMAELIDRSFELRARSQILKAQSACLREEAARARIKFHQEWMRSRVECARNRGVFDEAQNDLDSEEQPG